MKKNILAFFVGLIIGSGPIIHVVYTSGLILVFFVGKYVGSH